MQTYKFYTRKGERLGIFLRRLGSDDSSLSSSSAQIEVYRCSKKDVFKKKVARDAFNGVPQAIEKFHPETIPVDKNMTGREFYQWCVDHYCQKYYEVVPRDKEVFLKYSEVEEELCYINLDGNCFLADVNKIPLHE